MRGTIAIEIDGVTHLRDVALWVKTGQSGKEYFNGSITTPTEKNNAVQAVKMPNTAIVESQGSTSNKMVTDLPF